jgi:hypothetical protein
MKNLTLVSRRLLEKTPQQSPILKELERKNPEKSEIKKTLIDAIIKLRSEMNLETAEKPY